MEQEILSKHPGIKKRELYNLLFDTWFEHNPPQSNLVEKELGKSIIKSGDQSMQNLLNYCTEISRIESAIALSSFDLVRETDNFYIVLGMMDDDDDD